MFMNALQDLQCICSRSILGPGMKYILLCRKPRSAMLLVMSQLMIQNAFPPYAFRVNVQDFAWTTTNRQENGKPLYLSPHMMGWPEHRPRSFTILTRRDTCSLSGDGLKAIYALFRRPCISVAELFVAPQDRCL